MEHELNIDKSVDMRVPLRKIGRVAAFRKGLKHTGYNLVRTVADMQNIAQLLDWDRSVEEGVQEEKQVEQVCCVIQSGACACVAGQNSWRAGHFFLDHSFTEPEAAFQILY